MLPNSATLVRVLHRGSGVAATPNVGFVACIEGGVLEGQTLLMFESIRRFTGRFKDAACYALSPRAGYAISADGRARLDALRVHFDDSVINLDCPEYGSANRVAAAAHVEDNTRHDLLVIPDSDTLFLREPTEFLLAPDVDVAVRPVDVKGMASAGPHDPVDAYWRELCAVNGADYDAIARTHAFVDGQPIKASYNGGLVVARAGLGLMRRWADYFFASVRAGLRPWKDTAAFRAGVGWVDEPARRLWGSNQAALSVAIWNTTRRVRELSPTYNYPLHLHQHLNDFLVATVFPRLVHVHYHWLLERDALPGNPIFHPRGPLTAEQQDWLRSAVPVG
jgi:hypothetical protein